MVALTPTLAFDMFGTLVDPMSHADALRPHTDQSERLAGSWRTHQLEISWLLSLADDYQDWGSVTAYALDVALAEAGLDLSGPERETALARAVSPDLFEEVNDALRRLRAAGMDLWVFSNGTRAGLDRILSQHELEGYFNGVISCEEVGVYKPAPATYRHAADRIGLPLDQIWLVSGNPFDCAGGSLAGMHVVKVERTPSITYPFAREPDRVVTGLADLPGALPPG
jgi:2-haloacid dehalogenase